MIARLERLGEISVTKTPAGHRFIDLSPDTLRMVQHYVEKHAPVPNKYDLRLSGGERSMAGSEELDASAASMSRAMKAGVVTESEEDGETVVPA